MNEGVVLDSEQLFQNGDEFSIPSESDSTPSEIEGSLSDPENEQGVIEGSDKLPMIDIPEYSVDNPLPVVIVEEVQELEQVEVFALTGKYYGTISETYLDYFEGIVEKLNFNEHYVIWRSGQYAYTMAWGEDITLEGTYFSGTAESCTLFRNDSYNNNDWYVSFGSDDLALSAGELFVYSDLGMYPTVERGMKHGECLALLVSLAVATVFMLCHCIFDYIVKYVYRK